MNKPKNDGMSRTSVAELTPRAYYLSLIEQGHEAHHAASLTNAKFGKMPSGDKS
jgi:hypothetical protein